MTSQAAAGASAGIPEGEGLGVLRVSLHPPGRPGTKRAEHLAQVRCPCSFFRAPGTSWPNCSYCVPYARDLGSRATLREIETADHSFHVLKSSGRTDAEVLRELAQSVSHLGAENISARELRFARGTPEELAGGPLAVSLCFSSIVACAAASRAMGTRNGEALT